MLRKVFVTVAAVCVSCSSMAQQYSPSDFMKALEFYYYSSLTVEKFIEMGCKKHMAGLPVWFSMKAVQDEILSRSPDKARTNVAKFLADPSYRNKIAGFMKTLDDQKAQKTQSDFDVMCSSLGGSNVAEWGIYRKRYVEVSMNIDPKYLR